mgnify:CR=1 FL=1
MALAPKDAKIADMNRFLDDLERAARVSPAALEQAGCHPLQRSWHALRHTFASHFVMSGGSILALQKILGHHDIKQTMTYAHLAPEFLGDEMDRIKF